MNRLAATAAICACVLPFACGPVETDPGGTPAAAEGLVCEPGDVRVCYDGPAGTEGVGSCAPGEQLCASRGHAWGPCQGQVLPRQEICGDDSDDDCDGQVSCGETRWSIRVGVGSDEAVARVTSDGAAGAYIFGYYREPIDLGDGALTTVNDSRDLFVARYASDGQLSWSRGFHADGHLMARNLARTPDGGVVLVATARGAVQLGGQVIDGFHDDVLVVKLGGDGELVWARRYGDDASQHPSGVAVDGDGNVVVCGYARGKIDFGGGSLAASDVHWDAFVMQLSSAGEHRWSRLYAGDHDQVPRAVALDRAGGSYLAGDMQGAVDFGGGVLSSAGERDAFVLALDAQGEHRWSLTSGDDERQQAYDVDVDVNGDVVVTGRFEGEMRWGVQSLSAAAGGAIFVTKLDPGGGVSWAKRFGGSSNQAAFDVTSDSQGRIAIAGFYDGDMSVGDAQLPASGVGEPNILVVKLTQDGSPMWARSVGVDGDQTAGGMARGWRALAFGDDDQLLLAGFVRGEIDLGDGLSEGDGRADLFLAALAP